MRPISVTLKWLSFVLFASVLACVQVGCSLPSSIGKDERPNTHICGIPDPMDTPSSWEDDEDELRRDGSCRDSEDSKLSDGVNGAAKPHGLQPDLSPTLLDRTLAPVLASTLNAPEYVLGGEAAIFECVNGRIRELRWRTPTETYYVYSEGVGREAEGAGRVERGTGPECHPRSPGKKKALAMLTHSFLSCTQRWRDIATMLAERGVSVILPLLPGHGVSKHTEKLKLATSTHTLL
ncbi:unnamed protein product [Discosporangium mesarthrocarpum]